MNPKIEAIHSRMIGNAKAYNSRLDEVYLQRISIPQLLSFCHPADRTDFMREMNAAYSHERFKITENDV